MTARIVSEAELRARIALSPKLNDVISDGFARLSEGGVVMPPVLSMALHEANGEVDVKTAYIPGFAGFAIKVSPGFFDNPKVGLPSLNGLMVLLSAQTGLVQAIFMDNGYLTDLRTAAAGAVAARHLAPPVVETAGVIGTGVQARLQMRAAFLERPFKRLLVWGRAADPAEACAQDLRESLGIEVETCQEIAHLVAQSQLVVTTTPSQEPLIWPEHLHAGLHITAMGSDQSGKRELASDVLTRADLYVADRLSQTRIMGELAPLIREGLADQIKDQAELGDIILGTHQGRRSADQITIVDLTGTGVQDTAIASHTYSLIQEAG